LGFRRVGRRAEGVETGHCGKYETGAGRKLRNEERKNLLSPSTTITPLSNEIFPEIKLSDFIV
jgi:hypothetical protein